MTWSRWFGQLEGLVNFVCDPRGAWRLHPGDCRWCRRHGQDRRRTLVGSRTSASLSPFASLLGIAGRQRQAHVTRRCSSAAVLARADRLVSGRADRLPSEWSSIHGKIGNDLAGASAPCTVPPRSASRRRCPPCHATGKTDPLATLKTDPPWPGRSQTDESMRGCRPVGREATGRDDEIRRGGGDAASARARLGVEAHSEGVRVQQEHGAALRGGRRLDGLQPAGPRRQARGSGGMVEGVLLSAPRQCGRWCARTCCGSCRST